MIEFLRPPEDPINYEAHTYRAVGITKELHMTEVSQATRRDWAIRTSMKQALECDDNTVHEITKLLAGQTPIPVEPDPAFGPKPKLGPLARPFKMPDLKDNGSSNEALRDFAFDAFRALDDHFEGRDWKNWIIAPCFFEGDDTASTFELRIYVGEDIFKTVVE